MPSAIHSWFQVRFEILVITIPALPSAGLDGIQRDYGLFLRSSRQQMWFIFNTIGADQGPTREKPWHSVIKSDMTVADNTWHTVGVTFDPSVDRVEFYIDGVLRAAEVEKKTPDYNAYGPVSKPCTSLWNLERRAKNHVRGLIYQNMLRTRPENGPPPRTPGETSSSQHNN